MPSSRTPRSIRLSPQIEKALAAMLARSGLTFSALVEEALSRYIATQSIASEADLIDTLAQDFTAATFVLQVEDDEMSAGVTDVKRRTTDPLGRTYSPTQAPLEQFVAVEARPAANGRATIELVGLPGTSEAGVRVFVATLPAQPGASASVRLMDLHPLSRGAAEGDEDFEAVSW